MQQERYYSVRMRAARNETHEGDGKHISGGELLSTYNNIKQAVNALLDKALIHSRGNPDFMQIQFEAITEPIECIPPLTIKTHEVESADRGQELSQELLAKAGIQRKVIEKAYRYLADYSNMRGAMLVDVHSGERVDDRGSKGVRVSRMDWLNDNFEKWAAHYGLPNQSRIKEALILASKVSAHPATVAELCWSDDPEYITGYVASKEMGYQRINKLKEYGDEQGCRIFFVDASREWDHYLYYLEKQPVFIHWEGKRGGEYEAG
ncbi:6-carboxyhexanoate--CoA ligase [Bacillus sp. FJAT-27231]|uniref:6-carboxyhexanoate--CoA ligase n=1 Tax=Bacillus sp. FJAT-27231 TaxID=1679168 RepID=UPI0006717139|nr:6-carboxyhexanoate--CoA ligase [Bacillus sp. FJAT-27231]KMY54499.1 6-carboxyhexanoate--CoA ligase [Bacillus sp. FJAT-27231]